MYFFGLGIRKSRNKEDLERLFLLLKPYLYHGSILLTSTFENFSSLFSPTPIKHSSFCYIENNEYYMIEISNSSKLKKEDVLTFLEKKDTIFIFNYYDIEIMKKTMDYIFNYKDVDYGFFGKRTYCYKLIFEVYRDVYRYHYNIEYKKMSDFIPVINFFGLEYINANSILNSKKFICNCCFIHNRFITFEQRD